MRLLLHHPSVLRSLIIFNKSINGGVESVLRRGVVHVHHEFHDIIKWNKPEKLRHWDPRKTCDISQLPTLNSSDLQLKYQPFAHMINELSEDERKLFCLATGRRSDWISLLVDDATRLTKQHLYDESSLEYKIAKFTVKIRNNVHQLIEERKRGKRGNKSVKVCISSFVSMRHLWLTKLRNSDIKKFEWILPVVGVIYKSRMEFDEPVERKRSLRKLTDLYCSELISSKMEDYKKELDGLKVPFLEEKLWILREIEKDEKGMKIECSVSKDIVETVERLDKLKNNYYQISPIDNSTTQLKITET